MALSDPFHAVKAEVTQNAGAAEALAARWQELEGDRRAGEERKRLLQQLSDILIGVSADLEDLEETILLVEKQRSRFRIDDAELASRRGFIKSMKVLVGSIYRSVDLAPVTARAPPSDGAGRVGSGAATTSMADDSPPNSVRGDSERVGLLGGSSCGGKMKSNVASAAKSNGAMGHVQQAQQMQQMQIEQQDTLLDGLSTVVGRLKEQGNQINQELESQKTMLSTLEDQVEGAGTAMAKLKHKMGEMAKSKDRGKYCAILGLSILLVLLVTIVLSD